MFFTNEKLHKLNISFLFITLYYAKIINDLLIIKSNYKINLFIKI